MILFFFSIHHTYQIIMDPTSEDEKKDYQDLHQYRIICSQIINKINKNNLIHPDQKATPSTDGTIMILSQLADAFSNDLIREICNMTLSRGKKHIAIQDCESAIKLMFHRTKHANDLIEQIQSTIINVASNSTAGTTNTK
jgi:hypothetical protein